MTKKAKIMKGIKIAVCSILAAVLVIAGVLFFPLKGAKHVEIWSSGQDFDIAKIQTVEKDRADFKILMFTDAQLWADLSKNKACYQQMDELVEKTQPELAGGSIYGVRILHHAKGTFQSLRLRKLRDQYYGKRQPCLYALYAG